MPIKRSRWCAALWGAALLGGFLHPARAAGGTPSTPPATPLKKVDSLALLIPDSVSATDPRVTVWTDAMAEEGLQSAIVRDSQFLTPGFDTSPYAGFILPDQVHLQASDALVAAIQNYVNQGGQVMLTYDFGSLTDTGFYVMSKSRFSQLAGIDYVLNDLYPNLWGFGYVAGTEKTLSALRVPPGKSMTYDGLFTDVPTPVDAPDGKMATVQPTTPTYGALSGYVYGFLSYPGFITRGTYAGTPLLSSPSFGLAAGYNPVGKGAVLFVNIPLGYLKGTGTDGVFLHGFLHYFGEDLLHLPYLCGVPKGLGGMVYNWHLCAKPLQTALLQLKQLGVFKNNGPFSIHICAGPDCVTPGDGLGFDLAHNTVVQQALREFDSEGHQIGCHGGWIHDYWGANAPAILPTDPLQQQTWYNYLIWNKQAVEAVINKPVVEYAPPEGNEPDWVDTWLQQNGFLGYYFTGNTGLGPTRSYRNGQLLNTKIWSIPVSPYGQYATFDEFEEFGVSHADATSWLLAITNFTTQNRVCRMIYAHPPGAYDYYDSLSSLLTRTKQYQQMGQFRWYTMTDITTFLNRREKITWSVSAMPDGTRLYQVSSPQSLEDATWIFPKANYSQPMIIGGTGTITAQTGHVQLKLKSRKHDDDSKGGKHDDDDHQSKQNGSNGQNSGTTSNQGTANTQNSGTTVSQDTSEWLVTAGKGTTLQFLVKPL